MRTPLTTEELHTLCGTDDISLFLNTRHAIYKARGWDKRLPDREEILTAMAAEPNLLRRPVLRRDAGVVIGFAADKFRQLLIAG